MTDLPPIQRLLRVPGQALIRIRDPWMITSVGRPAWMGAGALKVLINRHMLVLDETHAYAEAFANPLLVTPGMLLDVEPWQAKVWGRKLTPESVLKFWAKYTAGERNAMLLQQIAGRSTATATAKDMGGK